MHVARALRSAVYRILSFFVAFAALGEPSRAEADESQRECQHLVEHLAIEQKLHEQLKHDKVRVRCGKRLAEGAHQLREMTVFKMPEQESTVRIDRFTGRILSFAVTQLPIPELKAPAGGWPSLGLLAEIAQKEGAIPAEAKLVKALYRRTTDEGLRAGERPRAEFTFEHRVEGAEVLGDRVEAHVELRSRHLFWMDARRWTEVKPPRSRTTEGRALRTARKAYARIDPAVVPCCEELRSGEAAEAAIADAIGGKRKVAKAAARRKRKSRRRRRGRRRHIAISCDPKLQRRVYLHDRRGRLVEAYQVSCVPSCTRNGVTRSCKSSEAAIAYIATKTGKLLGMKGQIAPARYRWQRPPPPRGKPLPEKTLRARADAFLKAAIARLQPEALFKKPACPPTENDHDVVRRCWQLMLPAMRYRARQTRTRIIFEIAK